MSPGARTENQWSCLAADFRRYLALYPGYPHQSLGRRIRIALTEETFWVIFWYRFGRWARTEFRVPVLRWVCGAFYKVVARLVRITWGISLPAECEVGPGLYFSHFGATWINPDVRMGRDVTVCRGVTIGLGGFGATHGVPEIGDFSYLGPNSTVVGKLRVGVGCVVGANSLVVGDVPDWTTALGVPARVVSKGGNVAARAAAEASGTPAGETSAGGSRPPGAAGPGDERPGDVPPVAAG